jgi:hypothetical protein
MEGHLTKEPASVGGIFAWRCQCARPAISQYLANAANSFGHAVERCVLAIDWIVRITRQVLLRGHLIGPRLTVADPGASGSNCLSGFVDGGGADGFREPTVCVIATEVSIRAVPRP